MEDIRWGLYGPIKRRVYWTDERLMRLVSMRKEGLTMQQIGDKFEVTRERIRQLLLTAKKRGIK